MITSCLLMHAAALNAARPTPFASQSPETDQVEKKQYTLPAGDAATMLTRFAHIAGREIIFSFDIVRNRTTAEVDGFMSAQEALSLMLKNSELTSHIDHASGAIAITRATDNPVPKTPSKRAPNFLRSLGASLALLAVGDAAAQTAPASPGGTQSEAAPIVLSPFQVSADQDDGYIATNTLSGSRVNTPLYTTPSVTSVFTRDFLDDIAANDLVEAYSYALNTDAREQTEQSSNFRGEVFQDNGVNIRGLTGQTARNYFVWTVNGDSYNLERLDFSRGPNNILFGIGGQGGVVNSTTKRGILNRNITKMQFRFGDWDLYRGHLDVNRPIGKNAAIRINLLGQSEGSWVNYGSYDKEGLHLAGTWQLFQSDTATTVVRAEFEKLNLNRVLGYKFPFQDRSTAWDGQLIPQSGSIAGITGTTTTPANRRIYDQAGGTFQLSTGIRTSTGPTGTSFFNETVVPRELNFFGPDNINNSDVENITASLEQRLFRNLYVELAFNRQSDFTLRNREDGFFIERDVRGFVGSTPNPRAGQYYSFFDYLQTEDRQRIDELRATVSYEKDFGIFGRHQIAGLVSRRDSKSGGSDFQFDDIGTNSLLRFQRWIGDGDSEQFTAFEPQKIVSEAKAAGLDVGFRQTSLTYSESRNDTAQVVHVGNFFDGRISTVFGLRKDDLFSRSVLNGTTDTNFADGLYRRRREWTNYQLTPWTDVAGDYTQSKGLTVSWSAEAPVRFFYNESESFVNQSGMILVGLTERNLVFPPRSGEGRDMGVRFRLFDGRVQGSVGHFKTKDIGQRHFLFGFFGQATQFVARDLLKRSDYTGWQDLIDVNAEGYEFELTANPTRNLRLHFNYSHTDLENSNHGPYAKRILIGQMLPEWKSWLSGWRAAPGEALPSGVSDNMSPAVTVAELGRPLTFQEAHGGGIDPSYEINSRLPAPTVTGTLGLADWISRVNYASDIWFTDGLAPRRHRADSFNFVANYTFNTNSPLKGWTVGGGARWRGKPIIDRSYDSDSNIVETFGDARVDTDMSISYTHKFEKVTVRTQLAVKNVFNSDTHEVINVAGNSDERGHIQFLDPRSFRLTVDLTF